MTAYADELKTSPGARVPGRRREAQGGPDESVRPAVPPGVRAREARRNGLTPDLRQATSLTGGSKARPGTRQPPRDHLPHRGGRRGLTGATGTRRRLQALMVNGWPAAGLAARIGLDATSLSRIADGAQDEVTGATADAVAHLYDRLWDWFPPPDTPGARAEAAATRALARRRHWAPALAWDDDRIDDPTATPQGVDPGPSRAQGPVARLVDASEELLAWGYTLRQAAERLGVSRNSLERARLRRGLQQTRPHLGLTPDSTPAVAARGGGRGRHASSEAGQ